MWAGGSAWGGRCFGHLGRCRTRELVVVLAWRCLWAAASQRTAIVEASPPALSLSLSLLLACLLGVWARENPGTLRTRATPIVRVLVVRLGRLSSGARNGPTSPTPRLYYDCPCRYPCLGHHVRASACAGFHASPGIAGAVAGFEAAMVLPTNNMAKQHRATLFLSLRLGTRGFPLLSLSLSLSLSLDRDRRGKANPTLRARTRTRRARRGFRLHPGFPPWAVRLYKRFGCRGSPFLERSQT